MPKVQIDCKIRVMHALSLEICIPVVKSQPTLTYADLRLSAIEARQMKIGGLYLYLYMDCVRAVQSCCMLTFYIYFGKRSQFNPSAVHQRVPDSAAWTGGYYSSSKF